MKNFKKSEVAIYAIALMLVAAGYFNYSTFEQKTTETYSEDIDGINEQYANVGDAVLVSNNEVENTVNETSSESDQENTTSQEANQAGETQNNEDTQLVTSNIQKNETIDTNTQVDNNSNETDYYTSSKLDRDKMYAEMITNYESILNNTNASEAQKSIATQEITKINNTKNAIMICENLILTKGFENCIILVNEDSVNVIVSITGGLTTEGVAKIQNIISREIGTEIENIHITEK